MTKSDESFPIVIWQSFIESILAIKRINRLWKGKQKIFEYYYNVTITWVKKMLATKSDLITSGLESVHCLLTSYVFIY